MRRAEELRYLILAAQREGNRLLAQALRPLGLTPSQAEVVRVLLERQPLSLNGIGELLICESGTNPSRLIERLVTAGIVQRQPSAHDRRHIELTLTPTGADLAGKVGEIEAELYRNIDRAAELFSTDDITGFLWAFLGDTAGAQALSLRAQISRPDGTGNHGA
ncbi:MarR family winged helix-turn-helix transcriptional regulator [Nocardia flavorosea]|uniref:Winged helix DNA-binding protein n=1 Tax=Nocardia flavorosea TaxID=53429 RepID=A0A846YL75_9NOCA|nr:winged helix DNA-binding protein [Nocardia flavorosea]NKY58344.1 winged helix DNA-binding protein [Nocardia flavorosea]